MSALHLQNSLVTGGGGFLGKAIIKRLLEGGGPVRSFSRSRYSDLEAAGVEQLQGDIGDPEAVAAACRGAKTVFHVAAKAGIWGRYEDYHRTNVVGTENVIAACKAFRVTTLVYTSSPSVVFDGTDIEGADESAPYSNRFLCAYPKTKALAEQAVIKASRDGLKAVILRPHLIWGPGDNHLVPRILRQAGRLRRIGDGRNLVDTVYIDNAADAHILAAQGLKKRPELSGRIYFISQGQPVPLWDMVNAILGAAGFEPVRKSISCWTARTIGVVLEAFYSVLGFESEPRMTRFLAEELATAHWFDIGAARRDLDYRPTVSTAEGLARLAEWLRREGLHAAV